MRVYTMVARGMVGSSFWRGEPRDRFVCRNGGSLVVKPCRFRREFDMPMAVLAFAFEILSLVHKGSRWYPARGKTFCPPLFWHQTCKIHETEGLAFQRPI